MCMGWGGEVVSVLVWALTLRCSLSYQLHQDIAHRSPRNPGGPGQTLWLLRCPQGKRTTERSFRAVKGVQRHRSGGVWHAQNLEW